MTHMGKLAAVAVAAMLAVAACGDENEPTATAAPPEPAADDSAIAELDARVEQLQTRIDELDGRLDELDDRLADVEPTALQSRLSEVEVQIQLLSEAVEELQAPMNLGVSDPIASPEAGATASPEAEDTETTD